MAEVSIEILVREIFRRLTSIEDRLTRLEFGNQQVRPPIIESSPGTGNQASSLAIEEHTEELAANIVRQPLEQPKRQYTEPVTKPAEDFAKTEVSSDRPQLIETAQEHIEEALVIHKTSPFMERQLEQKSSETKNAISLPWSPPTKKSAADNALETKIGSYWLNRAGLLALLIGVISLLLYSFQYFGAGVKITFGFVVAAAFVYFSRRAVLVERPWFANGLNALGWSIAFFAAYAMYYIPELKVLSFAPLEVVILAGIVSTMMAWQSELSQT